MFNSSVLEVSIGMVFCYASVALIVSSINEAIATLLNLRSGTLLTGIKALLNDPNLNGLALAVYNHALVNPRSDGNATSAQLQGRQSIRPSYIEAKNFGIALIDTIQTIPGNYQQLGVDINAIKDPQLKQLFQGMYTRASGDIESLHTQLAAWFDMGMDRVSGEYKRQSQLYCFLIAFIVALVFNIDSFRLFSSLWLHPTIAAGINVPGHPSDISWVTLMSLPIGWQSPYCMGFSTFFGWLVTASAALFGAPFWFDLLQQLIRLRGTGPKPDQPEKKVTQ